MTIKKQPEPKKVSDCANLTIDIAYAILVAIMFLIMYKNINIVEVDPA
jgi:hypothetical protein